MKKNFLHRWTPASRIDYEKDLNPEQYRAVMHGEGPALVLAGAGTGKTRVVTYRVARLIETGIKPENILLLTFTNKAAREMMTRAQMLIGRNISGLFGGTFHHAANLILRRHYAEAGYKRGFSILDREDSKELFDSCIAGIFGKKTALPRGAVLCEIWGLVKNTGTAAADIVLKRFPHFGHMLEDIEKIIARYEEKKLALNLADFDDLLLNWKKLFQENEAIRQYYSLRFKYLLVDEYQDTNRLQADIIDLTTCAAGNLMVVGDDAQSIYSFRGADFENILTFPEKYKGASVFTLTMNYRSTPDILYLANGILSNNRKQFHKELRSVLNEGQPPGIAALKDSNREAEFVSSIIAELISEGRPPEAMAVLYRSHYQSMHMQMEFQRRGISFEVRSGLKFFETAHIKDVLAYLKILVNPFDEVSWKRVLRLIQGIGPATAGRLWEGLRASGAPLEFLPGAVGVVPKKSAGGFGLLVDTVGELADSKYFSAPSAAVEYVLRHGYEDHLCRNYPNAEARVEDILQMARFALNYDSLENFLADLALQTEADSDKRGDGEICGGVVLSTIHQAKGLEWDVVFIIGMSDGRFPSAKSLRNEDEEEERRLFYVGATRAKETLYLSYPVSSDDWNANGFLRPSRFLKELPGDCFEEISAEDV